MSNAYPYVYICTHKITKQYYIGYRSANSVPSHLDLPKYRTSSLVVRPEFESYDWQIIAEFFDGDSAYDFEQELINQNWNDPLLLNGQHRYNAQGRFKSKPGRIVSEETKEKIRQKLLGKKQSPETVEKKAQSSRGQIPWNKGIKSGPMSEENKQKISLANKGRPKSQEHKDKQSATMKDREPWNKGRKKAQALHLGHIA